MQAKALETKPFGEEAFAPSNRTVIRCHIGLNGVEKMAAAYPETPLILWHWGSVDAPEWKEFNGNPEVVKNLVINPQRVIVLAPGEGYCLKKLPEQAGL